MQRMKNVKVIKDRSSKDGRACGDIYEMNDFEMNRVPCNRWDEYLLSRVQNRQRTTLKKSIVDGNI